MRFTKKIFVYVIAILMLYGGAAAQTQNTATDPNCPNCSITQDLPEPVRDPRNISPSVGTGGPPGGPTGLFTIYDGQTLRRGEFTFSIAYSNFDRDPGNVDITEVPISFQVGLNDHLELFFNTDAYRGVKVNNPQNLSGFYLPNSQLKFPFLGSGPAIVLAPQGPNVGTLRGTAVFRPAFNQPFVQFPFTGGSAGSFGLTPGNIIGNFGFPGFNATLGPPIIQPNSGNFGPADNFPGIGSVVGGILPGIVLATNTLPATLLTLPITVPVTFTIAPSYLPDAPFINRLYGQSSFSTFSVGAKWRWTGPNNPLGVGVIGLYRFYADRGDDFSGFNQLQRGASPGGSIGDFGAIFFLDARLSRSVNVSVNGGLIVNSNPKANFNGQDAVLLDRPNEFVAGIGFDFPVNKYIQPILELKSDQYVGGRTPNAFENSPVDALAGVKLYPHRWLGIGLAYRYHLNQQDRALFKGVDANTTINQITNVNPIGPQPITVIPATSRPATTGGFPRGFIESDDANGFIAQAWIGRRNKPELPSEGPHTLTAAPSASASTIYQPCPPYTEPCDPRPSDSQVVQLAANATDTLGHPLLYSWHVDVGRITGEGANVSWDLSDVAEGSYTATVTVDDGCGCVVECCVHVTVRKPRCVKCPTVAITFTYPPKSDGCVPVGTTVTVPVGTTVTAKADISGLEPGTEVRNYNWEVSAGTIKSGQNTPTIEIDTTEVLPDNEVVVTLTVTIACGDQIKVCPPYTNRFRTCPKREYCEAFDAYNDLEFNDEKARLDNFAIRLQTDPRRLIGYYVIWGSCDGEGQKRADRAVAYLVNTRGIDASRIKTVVDPNCRETLTVELIDCPLGETPEPQNSATRTPCPKCPNKAKAARHPSGRKSPTRRSRRGR